MHALRRVLKRRWKGILAVLAVIGPGVITANVGQ